MIKIFLPWIGATCLAGGAFFFGGQVQYYALIGIMLFWPLLDPHWRPPRLFVAATANIGWLILLASAAMLLLIWRPQHLSYALTSLLFAALPEEWFFRAYFMTRIRHSIALFSQRTLRVDILTNIITSALFSLLHGLAQNWTLAILVFIPSLIFGWLYQRSRDIVLVVLVHAVSNLVFIVFIRNQLSQWL